MLGPLLFSPLIDDLPSPLNVTWKTYTDDAVLYAKDKKRAVQALTDEMCITGLKNPNYT